MNLTHSDIHNYDLLPNLDGLQRYVNQRVPCGGFLTAVLENNLRLAVERADDTNIWLIPVYVSWLYNHAPSDCWGSREAVTHWLSPPSA